MQIETAYRLYILEQLFEKTKWKPALFWAESDHNGALIKIQEKKFSGRKIHYLGRKNANRDSL